MDCTLRRGLNRLTADYAKARRCTSVSCVGTPYVPTAVSFRKASQNSAPVSYRRISNSPRNSAGMNSLGRQVFFETSLSPEDVDRYLETAFRYCERVRDSFCIETPESIPPPSRIADSGMSTPMLKKVRYPHLGNTERSTRSM